MNKQKPKTSFAKKMGKRMLISIPITIVVTLIILFISLLGVDIGEPGSYSGSCGPVELGVDCSKYIPPPNITWPDLIIRFSNYSILIYPAVFLTLYYAKWRIENPVIIKQKTIVKPRKKSKKAVNRKAK